MLETVLKFNTILFLIIYVIWYFLVVLIPRKKVEIDYSKNDKYHHYFLIPCLNEAGVIADTIRFWDKTLVKYPNIQILLIDDASDDDTNQIIKNAIANKKQYQLIERKKPNAQTGKGDALNYAYQFVLSEIKRNNYDFEKSIVTVFDADAIILENYINELEANFSPKNIALVQARVAIINKEKWLGLMQDIDFYTCVDGIQNLRESLQNVGAGGNGQSIRISSIIDNEKPWGDALLEDFEFSTRLLLNGFETRHMHREAVYQQGVDTYKPFIKQRARWAQGGIQCLKYIKTIFNNDNLNFTAKLEMFYFMILPFISIIGICSYLLLTILMLLDHQTLLRDPIIIVLLISNFLTGIIIAIKYYMQIRDKFNIFELMKYVLIGSTVIFYDWCLVPAQVLAVVREYRHEKDWVKTARHKVNYHEFN